MTRSARPSPHERRPATPAAFSCVQQTGVGHFDYRPPGGEAIHLLTGIGRIRDFDVFGRDGLMSRIVYLRDNATREFWTVNWEPVRRQPDRYTCTRGILGDRERDLGDRLDVEDFRPCRRDPVELWTRSSR